MRKITCFILVILFSTMSLSNNSTNTTAKKPFSCYLADASLSISKYFVTGNLIYLAAVNLILPVLAGLVLPIILAKLMGRTHPNVSLPAEVVPVEPFGLSPIEPMSDGKRFFYSGVVAFFSLFVANNNNIGPAGISMKDTSAAAAQLSAKDIINIALALISFGAFTWNQVQQSLCEYDRQ